MTRIPTISELKNKKLIWILLPGLLIVYISRLFFSLNSFIDLILLFYGLMFTAGGLLFILFSALKLKQKLISVAIVALSAVLFFLVEPLLINASFQIYLCKNIDNLEKSNEILLNSNETVVINASNDQYMPLYGDLTAEQVEKVREILNNVGAYTVWKDNNSIYYGLYGFLDVRWGVTYYIEEKSAPVTKLKFLYLRDNWYIDFFGDEL